MAMLGCRPLTGGELYLLVEQAAVYYCRCISMRMQCKMVLMASTGLRIGEARTLHIGDVAQGGRVAPEIYLQRRYAKGKPHGSRLPLGNAAQDYLQAWLDYSLLTQRGPQAWLFPPSRGSWTDLPLYDHSKPLDDRSARKNLDQLVAWCGLLGKVSWHSFRKYFAARIHETSGHDILMVKAALRHDNLSSTLHYLDINDGELYKLMRMAV